jgi:hypothetical protein
MLVHVLPVGVVQVPLVEVIDVAVVHDGDMTASGTVRMVVGFGVLLMRARDGQRADQRKWNKCPK